MNRYRWKILRNDYCDMLFRSNGRKQTYNYIMWTNNYIIMIFHTARSRLRLTWTIVRGGTRYFPSIQPQLSRQYNKYSVVTTVDLIFNSPLSEIMIISLNIQDHVGNYKEFTLFQIIPFFGLLFWYFHWFM